MIELRPYNELGGAQHGWLDTRHHFSFADYYNPKRMSWGQLRVWNDDSIAARSGFPPHPHRDMEIITYVRSGAITHEDNLGNRGRTEAGDVQVMSAGSGIAHSEMNEEDVATQIFKSGLCLMKGACRQAGALSLFQRANAVALLSLWPVVYPQILTR